MRNITSNSPQKNNTDKWIRKPSPTPKEPVKPDDLDPPVNDPDRNETDGRGR